MAPKTKTKDAVATLPKGGALSTKINYEEDAGGGFEGTSSSDFKIPFLSVLQSNSPEAETANPKYIDGAVAGTLMNTVTKELYTGDEGLVFVPCVTRHCFVEWVPRSQGGGYVQEHDLNSPVVAEAVARFKALAEKGDQRFPRAQSGNDIVDSYYLYGLVIDGEDNMVTQVVIGCTSSKIGPYRELMTKLRTLQVQVKNGPKVTPPLFANRVRVKTVPAHNPKTDSHYHTLEFTPAKENILDSLIDPEANEDLFVLARGVRDSILSGATTADYSESTTEGGGGDGQGSF